MERGKERGKEKGKRGKEKRKRKGKREMGVWLCGRVRICGIGCLFICLVIVLLSITSFKVYTLLSAMMHFSYSMLMMSLIIRSCL